jgi:hypothetical protein
MKNKFFLFLLLVLLIIGMTACQSDQTEDESPQPQPSNTEVQTENESEPVSEATQAQPSEGETGYPVGESTPTKIQSQPAGESAYPVSQEDLALLIHTWSLTNYLVDQESLEVESKTIKFNSDGTFEMTTDEGIQSGQWRTKLTAVESSLIFDSESGVITYEIVDLTTSALNLRQMQGDLQIDEQYFPAD